jgi:hypothetical protein
MLEVEEAIALNFNFFSEAELESIPAWLLPLREIAQLQTYSSKGSVGKMVENPTTYQAVRMRRIRLSIVLTG